MFGEVAIGFFVVVAFMGVSAVLFTGWLTFVAARGVGKLMGLIFLGPIHCRSRYVWGTRTCPRCRRPTSLTARFCPRCGQSIG